MRAHFRMCGRSVVSVALLVGAILCMATRPAAADFNPPVHANMFISAINGAAYHSDQATVNVGDHVQLSLFVQFRTGPVMDFSTDADSTRYFTSPPRGTFSGTIGRVWTPGSAEANKTITIYGSYFDDVSKLTIQDTVIVHVRRNDGKK